MTMQQLTATDPETQSADIVADNLAQLQALFPEAFSEGKVQFEVLKQLLGGAVDESDEKYGLNWHGKRRARQIALTPSTGTLRPCPEDSVDWDTTQNLMIEGDNLEVLKLLQKSYAGRVKLIYIDPPYNTGKDFVYPDNYRDSIGNYLELTGQVEGGTKLSANTDASGRFHTDWLSMIYPRLRLARSLLDSDGVLFCSIDDIEAPKLRMMLDEVFGEENFMAQFSWKTDGNFDNQAKIKVTHEYILMYARDTEYFPHPPVVDPSVPSGSKLFKPEIRNTIVKNGPKNPVSEIVLPAGFPASFDNGVINKRDNAWPKYIADAVVKNSALVNAVTIKSGWSSRDLLVEFINGGFQPILDSKGQETTFEITRTGAVEVVKSRTDYKSHVISTLSGFGGPQKATAQLEEIGAFFNGYPKPVDLIRYLVQMVGDKDALIVDFFAGSGPTGHAVMEQNLADSGNRRFILVQLPEPLDPLVEQQKPAADYCDRLGIARTVAELTKERLRRAGRKISNDNPSYSGDVGFRAFRLDKSNIREWYIEPDDIEKSLLSHAEHILSDRSESDIAYELLLKLGLDLCVPMESKEIAGKTVEAVGGGVLMLCLAEKIAAKEVEALAAGIVAWHKALAPAGDSTVVFRDSAFADDVAKTNMAAILAQNGLENVRSL